MGRSTRAGAVVAALTLALTGCAAPVAPEAEGQSGSGAAETQTQGPSPRPERERATPRPSPAERSERTPRPRPQAAPRPVMAAASALQVKGRAPMTGYDRDRFGPAWLDADRNGCDTRNDVLRRDLRQLAVAVGTNGCVVDTGVLVPDPFTGSRIRFERGDGFLVDIDHVVALGNAWSSGAGRWDVAKRAAFANDPLNLLAVDAGANRSKGDGDAATWLPPHQPFRCAYVARQVAVKTKYDLAVTPAERDAIVRVLSSCRTVSLPRDPGAPVRVDQDVTDPGAPEDREPAPAPRARQGTRPAPSDVYYENCDAARAAGAAPVQSGQPGYGTHLDRDGDGTGCDS